MWSAGLVGAALATSVVLVSTHMSTWVGMSVHTASRPASQMLPVRLPNGSPKFSANTPTSAKTVSTTTTQPGSTSTTIIVHTQQIEKMAEAAAVSLPLITVGRDGARSNGAGIVVRSDGLILAPDSLVAGADWLTVSLPGEVFVGSVLGSDPATGLALVQINTTGLVVPRVAGLHQSSLGSLVSMVWVEPQSVQVCLGTVAKTDAQLSSAASPPLMEAVNPTAASPAAPNGAALLDGSGALVGIVTGSVNGAALVTPAWLAMIVADDLIAPPHRVVHGYLGISGTTLANAMKGLAGVQVVSVTPKSAAAAAGLRAGDVIESVNGSPVATMSDIVAVLYSLSPDAAVELGVVRNHHLWLADARLAPAA